MLPTLNLVRDCTRFVLTFFGVISLSGPHIYHSALPLSPSTSIIHKIYKQHASPFFRVVQGGVPVSWQPATATATLDIFLCQVVWSPCNKFAAVITRTYVEVVDSVTLSRLSTFQQLSDLCSYQLLGFSSDSHYLILFTDERIISWDLQTGVPLSFITERRMLPVAPYSFTHSKDGKVVVVAYKNTLYKHIYSISAYDHFSGTCIGSTHPYLEGEIIYPIWTHDEYLQFATINPGSITIWQSPFTLKLPPVEVESLPIPDGVASGSYFLFLPALSRLAFILNNTIQVWDVKASKILLKFYLPSSQSSPLPRAISLLRGSFSSDGHLFAYNTVGEVYVWKESPTGYVVHQWFSFPTSSFFSQPRLSPNGESIIVPLGSKIHRMDTINQIPCGSSISTGHHNIALDFLSNENFAAFAQLKENIVTILDLKSGQPRSITNMGMEIYCLGITGDIIIVVGAKKAITWNLSGGNHTVNTSINESIQTITLNWLSIGVPASVSISPDFSHIAVLRMFQHDYTHLEVYDALTGMFLGQTEAKFAIRIYFSPSGCSIWALNMYSYGQQYKIDKDGKTGRIQLEAIEAKSQSMVPPWKPPHSYEVTEDGWILSPTQKQLLWLPHHWRVAHNNRIWGGQFLGLLPAGELSEMVILEFFE